MPPKKNVNVDGERRVEIAGGIDGRDGRDEQQQARLDELKDLNRQLKATARDGYKAKASAAEKRDERAASNVSRQKEARTLKTASKRTQKAKAVVDELLDDEAEDGEFDLADLTFEQMQALKSYGGFISNMTRDQVNEVLSRVSPLTEDGTPFVITTPVPTKRYLNPRRLKIKDIVTGREITL
jgi:hypothetical protein